MHYFSNNRAILLALAGVMLLNGQVSSHGHMTSPPIRIAPGDQNNGLTITRGPTHTQPCAGNAPGAVQSTFVAGSAMPISWEIGAAHQGTCFVEISTTPDTNFQVLKEFPNCADQDGTFSDTVPIPSNVSCDHCTIRWRWEAKLTAELYLDCADVKITGGQTPTTSPNPQAVKAATGSSDANTTTGANTTTTGTNTTNTGTDTTTTGTDTTTTETNTTTTNPAAANSTVQPDATGTATVQSDGSAAANSTDCMPTTTGAANGSNIIRKGRRKSRKAHKKHAKSGTQATPTV